MFQVFVCSTGAAEMLMPRAGYNYLTSSGVDNNLYSIAPHHHSHRVEDRWHSKYETRSSFLPLVCSNRSRNGCLYNSFLSAMAAADDLLSVAFPSPRTLSFPGMVSLTGAYCGHREASSVAPRWPCSIGQRESLLVGRPMADFSVFPHFYSVYRFLKNLKKPQKSEI